MLVHQRMIQPNLKRRRNPKTMLSVNKLCIQQIEDDFVVEEGDEEDCVTEDDQDPRFEETLLETTKSTNNGLLYKTQILFFLEKHISTAKVAQMLIFLLVVRRSLTIF